eukprot:TRINITY_DN2229_c0_g1_i4.p1 TRINITY_DN2229_c0_g1~~TRINITY_DN2229_c0_g1_i4.p1  ORF type:complete len:308 (-),score=59.17 TRINITY_DN2229_c0_g1_i4:38-961(-)
MLVNFVHSFIILGALEEKWSKHRNVSRAVKLNIGGKKYTTTMQTLMNHPNSMFSVMFSGRHSLQPDDKGYYFIDRDGEYFGYILNYLREGDIEIHKSHIAKRLLREADFYGLTDLIDLLQDSISEKYTTTWSNSRRGSDTTLFDGNLKVTTSAMNNLVVANDPLPLSGSHYWEIVHSKPESPQGRSLANCYALGVCSNDLTNYNDFIYRARPQRDHVWAIEDNGKRSNAHLLSAEHNLVPWGSSGFGNLDRVGVLVNRDEKAIYFYLNGRPMGRAYTNLPDIPLFPFASLINQDVVVEISFPKIPDQ